MNNYEGKKYLITENGDMLFSRQEIVNYLKDTSEMLKMIRQTSKFGNDFMVGNVDDYFELEEKLKLTTQDNQKLSFDETYMWLELNKIR